MTDAAVQDLYPEDVAHCYGCGRLNEAGHHLRTHWVGGEGVARYTPGAEQVSIPGFAYGGLLASLVDCHGVGTAAAASMAAEGEVPGVAPTARYVTASLHVDFLKPTPLGVELVLRGRPREVGERKVVVAVEVEAGGRGDGPWPGGGRPDAGVDDGARPVSLPPVPAGWPELRSERGHGYFRSLESFLAAERASHGVYPSRDHVFRALELTPRAAVRVVVLGQDPYHGPGQAHGLAFSVPAGVAKPPSLRNLLTERETDLGLPGPEAGDLTPWARRGVLLLNAVLTVREGEPGSHRGQGWERFTDAAVRAVNDGPEPVVFVLLGNRAREKASGVDRGRHAVLEAPHPSPLSAWRGFFGSRIYSRTNAALAARGRDPVDWRLEG